jgi:bacteriorhodopsin
MKTSSNWPLTAYLIALIICAILFVPDWEYAIQAKTNSQLSQLLAGVLLPLCGITIFIWSLSQAKKLKSKRYIDLNIASIIVIVVWLAFTTFAITIGWGISRGLGQLSY